MSLYFSRTTRSIRSDNLRLTIIALAFLVLLSIGWGGWFFLAKIPFYETSTGRYSATTGVISTSFSPEVLSDIQLGQSAIFRFEAKKETKRTIAAIVIDIDDFTNQVQLIPQRKDGRFPQLTDGITGEVAITVERISPASLILQTAGLVESS